MTEQKWCLVLLIGTSSGHDPEYPYIVAVGEFEEINSKHNTMTYEDTDQFKDMVTNLTDLGMDIEEAHDTIDSTHTFAFHVCSLPQ